MLALELQGIAGCIDYGNRQAAWIGALELGPGGITYHREVAQAEKYFAKVPGAESTLTTRSSL